MSSEMLSDLKSLLLEVDVYDPTDDYVYFDRVWHEPAHLKRCASWLHRYILNLKEHIGDVVLPRMSELVILSPDPAQSNFGTIPVSVLVADLLGCHFAVWKELADIRLGTSAIMGSKKAGFSCIVIQDVIRGGSTASRVARAMKELDWTFLAYIGIVLNCPEGDGPVKIILAKVHETYGQSPSFAYLLTANEIRKTSAGEARGR